MEKYHIVNFSGGKDSTAMLLRMIELKMPIDEIIFCDTSVEFPQMYEHIAKVEQYIGRKITKLKAEHDFKHYMFDYAPKYHRNKGPNLHTKGLSFPSFHIRWCTRRLKADIGDNYIRSLKKTYDVQQYIGIAADEPNRIKDKIYPLVEWSWTEKDCLEYCYNKGFTWGRLYEIFDRVSCWCCPLARLNYYRQLRKYFPDLWEKLLSWQHKTYRSFRTDYTVDELDARFAMEAEWELAGKNWHSRDFLKEFRTRMKEEYGT